MLTAHGEFTRPDRLTRLVPDRRPAETAYVLARAAPDEGWRYCGVARWLDEEGAWALPEVDFLTWRALGRGRDCSRRLPETAARRATELLDQLWQKRGAGAWFERDGKRCRLLERTAAGMRIDG